MSIRSQLVEITRPLKEAKRNVYISVYDDNVINRDTNFILVRYDSPRIPLIANGAALLWQSSCVITVLAKETKDINGSFEEDVRLVKDLLDERQIAYSKEADYYDSNAKRTQTSFSFTLIDDGG